MAMKQFDMTDSPGFLQTSSKNRLLILLVLCLVLTLGIGFMIGILIGKFGICDEEDGNGVSEDLVSEADSSISDKILSRIDPARIEANLRSLTLKPHIAGRPGDFETVELLKTSFQNSGLHVQTTPYDILLSYPGEHTPNSVRLLDGNGQIIYDAVANESDISEMPDVVRPFNAYSPSALVQGDLVYVGYGRVEDYVWLHEKGINVSGHIAIAKYGKIFRGDKVDIAANNGAIGIIIYSDPADCTGFLMGDDRVYPETWWLPPTGAQRGTIFKGAGDPLTPGYPANSLAYRFREDNVDPPMPKIPSHPIGYGAAVYFLSQLAGLDATNNSDFTGGLNITYRTGPFFQNRNMKVQLNVTTRNERQKAENVFGIIKGAIEPDRYVLFGNHRDAWIYGAVDPSSGTAVMMEVARVMGEMVKNGEWKPRRSIIFCSWGAEEYGLIGSTEWVEQYVATLRERAVAYINVDIAVNGNDTLGASGTPLMYNIIHQAAKKVKNPNPSEIQAQRPTVYDTWVKIHPWDLPQGDSVTVPWIGSLGSGSDYAPLLQRAGITAVDMTYTYDRNIYKVSTYALYHTEYETFDIFKNQFDKNFEVHAAVGRVSGEIARNLADSLILPFNISNYPVALEVNRQALHRDYGTILESNLTSELYGKLKTVIEDFAKDVADFESRKQNINKANPYAIRAVNDQIMLLEKAFLNSEGLPVRPLKKHLIFAENLHDSYAGSSFPGLLDLLFEIGTNSQQWEKAKQHFHTILQTIQSAGATLREVTSFMSETL